MKKIEDADVYNVQKAEMMEKSPRIAALLHDPDVKIVLGKKSGIDSIAIKAKELGIALTAEQQQTVLAAVKRLGVEKRGLLTDAEFRSIVDRVENPIS